MLKKVYRPIRAFRSVDKRLRGRMVPCIDKKVFDRLYRNSVVIVGYTIMLRENDEDDVLIFPGEKERSFAVVPGMPQGVAVRCYVIVSDTEAVAICSPITKLKGLAVTGCVGLVIAVIAGTAKVLPIVQERLKSDMREVSLGSENLQNTEEYVTEFFGLEESTGRGETGSRVSDLGLLDEDGEEESQKSDKNTEKPTKTDKSKNSDIENNKTTESSQAEIPEGGNFTYEADWLDVDAHRAGMSSEEQEEEKEFKNSMAFPPKFLHLYVTSEETTVTVENGNSNTVVKLSFSGTIDDKVELKPGKSAKIEIYSKVDGGMHSLPYFCSLVDENGGVITEFNSSVSVTVKK